MGSQYYSQRKKQQSEEPDREIGQRFRAAFSALTNRLTAEGYLCNAFPLGCGQCAGGRDDRAISARLVEELGTNVWPMTPTDEIPTYTILDLLQFFFNHVAQPVSSWRCSQCGQRQADEYDIPKGRYQYTVDINRMLSNFHHPYQLQKGQIILVGSEVLDRRLMGIDLATDDTYLIKLMSTSVEDFHARSGKRRLEAVQTLVDAFERVKTLHGTDKKQSAQKVIAQLSADADISSYFAQLFRALTDIENNCNLRHHEYGTTVIDDPALIEYLFYEYYNLIRLILEKHGLAKGAQAPDTAAEPGAEIPSPPESIWEDE